MKKSIIIVVVCFVLKILVFSNVYADGCINIVDELFLSSAIEIPSEENDWAVVADDDGTVFMEGQTVYLCFNSIDIDFDHMYKIEFWEKERQTFSWCYIDTFRTGWGTNSSIYAYELDAQKGEYIWKIYYSTSETGDEWCLVGEIDFQVFALNKISPAHFLGNKETLFKDTIVVYNVSNYEVPFILTLYSEYGDKVETEYSIGALGTMEICVQDLMEVPNYGEIQYQDGTLKLYVKHNNYNDRLIMNIDLSINVTASELLFPLLSKINLRKRRIIIMNPSENTATVTATSYENGNEVETMLLEEVSSKSSKSVKIGDYFEDNIIDKIILTSIDADGNPVEISGFSIVTYNTLFWRFLSYPAVKINGM